ncbi:serine/threonine-protein kinase [Spongiactinospora sp. TRM90649]|uniref:serine/threonine-protein kinase n=1 Tax=Spongiactinospora sp. TRM90649 TaxID=3031114 RepID=UPI0023F622D8|nr:serine/threonine-protein kinase [Spongiactinospora sp. TRM90649]MDF5751036.1 serine/threonine-protein kinase [Spongiactinospora sp. TRM90649]
MADRSDLPLPLAGRYRPLERLGAGGMGVVWRAQDDLLGREVAIKEMRPAPYLPQAQRAELNERTMREARAAAMLGHPAIVAVHDVILQDDRPWIVMDLVKGLSLEQAVKRDGPLPPERVAVIGLAVLDALAHAHRGGLMHRDVKPGNIMIAEDGRVLLTDFGIATLENDTGPTRPGSLVGSPGYIAPERLRGAADGPSADLWSLGATLYAAVEGRSPFHRAMPVATLGAVLTQPTPPPTRAGHLGPVLLTVLEKDPRVRPGVTELRTALRAVAEGRAAPSLRRGRPARRLRVTAAILAVLAVVAVGAGIALTRSGGGPGGPAAATSPTVDPRLGRFPEPPDPCALLTHDQAARIAPTPESHLDEKAGKFCYWNSTSGGDEVRITIFHYKPSPTLTAPEVANAFLLHEREKSAADAGTGTFGEARPPYAVSGVGKDSFAVDNNAITDRAYTTVVFQSSNLMVKVQYSIEGKKMTPELAAKGLEYARYAAEELNSRG